MPAVTFGRRAGNAVWPRNRSAVEVAVSDMSKRPVVYLVCTGNAARSPIAAAMLRACDADRLLDVRSAGTWVIEGQPVGWRTREALAQFGLVDHRHRSRQFAAADAAAADLVVVMEPDHIAWIRANFPEIAGITGSLRRLARDPDSARPSHDHPAGDGADPSRNRPAGRGLAAECSPKQPTRLIRSRRPASRPASFANASDPSLAVKLQRRVAALGLAEVTPAMWEEIEDPGSGEVDAFYRAAAQLQPLIQRLYSRLCGPSP